jgi:hypothetical protein
MKVHFARHGIPESVRSDGGPQFASQQFAEFAEKWRFRHNITSPYHSQSNGKAESAVKEAKKILKKCSISGEDPLLALLEHRNTPTVDLDLSPCQRLFNRRARTRIPVSRKLLDPTIIDPKTVRDRLRSRIESQQHYYDRGSRALKPLQEGDMVWIQPLGGQKEQWEKGQVLRQTNDRSYEVKTQQGMLRRNRIHLRYAPEATEQQQDGEEQQSPQEFVLRNRRVPKFV